MKKLSLTSVAMAVAAFVAAPAFAATNLNTGAGVQRYASELTPTSAAPIRLAVGAVNDLTANVALGWGFSANTTFYVRFDVAGGTFNGTMVAAALNVNGAGAGTGVTVSQSTSSYVVFSVSSPVSLDQSVRLLLAPSGTFDGINVTDKAGVTLRYRVYSDAVAAAGPTGGTGLSDSNAVSFVSFALPGYSANTASGSGVANVAATPVYSEFVSQAPTNSTATIQLGSITSAFNASVANENGAAFGVGAFNNTSTVVVTATSGDFSMTANANGAYDATSLARVFMASSADCNVANSVANVSTLTASTATFTNVAAANFAAGTRYICATARAGATIGAATFSLSSSISPSATRYGNITSPTAASFGTITQNGATIYVPVAQVPSGYIARLVLTNITATARPYTITAIGESGATVTLTGAASSGTLLGNRMNVIDLAGAMSVVGGAPRSSLRVTVNGPASAIRAAYQLVGPDGSPSNTNLAVE